MKQLIITCAMCILGLTIYGTYIMGNKDTTIQGAVSNVMKSNVDDLRKLP